MLQFLCFYCSVSCKRQDNRELIRKNDETSRVNNFKDFLIKVSFPDFHFEKAIKCHKNQRQFKKKCSVNDVDSYIFLLVFPHKLIKASNLFSDNYFSLRSCSEAE